MTRDTPRSRLRPGALAVVAVTLLAAGCSSGDSALDRVGAPTMTGAWVAPAGAGDDPEPDAEAYLSAREDFADATSSDVAVGHFFYPWASDPLVGGREAAVLEQGGVPLVSWNDADNQRIASGADDARIRRAARRFADLDGPVMLRWGWEMDADSGDGGTGTSGGPRDYIGAWRRIHQAFRDEGADNVEFVWCPNAYAFTEEADRSPTEYYPGDEYVDWLCADGYNWYPERGGWTSFRSIFRDFYDWASTRSKPIMIAEFGSFEDPADPGRRAAWIDDLAVTVKCDMPEVRALVYFEELKRERGKVRDWRIATSREAATAWKRLAADQHFGGNAETVTCPRR